MTRSSHGHILHRSINIELDSRRLTWRARRRVACRVWSRPHRWHIRIKIDSDVEIHIDVSCKRLTWRGHHRVVCRGWCRLHIWHISINFDLDLDIGIDVSCGDTEIGIEVSTYVTRASPRSLSRIVSSFSPAARSSATQAAEENINTKGEVRVHP